MPGLAQKATISADYNMDLIKNAVKSLLSGIDPWVWIVPAGGLPAFLDAAKHPETGGLKRIASNLFTHSSLLFGVLFKGTENSISNELSRTIVLATLMSFAYDLADQYEDGLHRGAGYA